MHGRSKFTNEMKKLLEQRKINECTNNLVALAFSYNQDIINGENYEHDLKHRLFFTDFIKSPLQGKYNVNIYNETLDILQGALDLLNIIDKAAQEKGNKHLQIDRRITSDIYEIIMYLIALYDFNQDNQEALDHNSFSHKNFIEQLILVSLHYQNETLKISNSLIEHTKKYGIGRMPLSVTPIETDVNKAINGASLDTVELELEAINQIVRYLFYKYNTNFEENIDISPTDIAKYGSIEDPSLVELIKIDAQYSLLNQFEESERYRFIYLKGTTTLTDGTKVYHFDFEDEKTAFARYYGIYRRQEIVYLHSLLFNYQLYRETEQNKLELAQELLSIQDTSLSLLKLEGFKPDKDKLLASSMHAIKTIDLVKALTKPLYLELNSKGILITDLINAYFYLITIADIVECASMIILNKSDKSTYWKSIAVTNINYFAFELSRLYGYDVIIASRIINCLVFHEKNNKGEDIFSNPLIKVSKTQVLFCHGFVSQTNINRVIEKQLSATLSNEKAEAGIKFEQYFISVLKKGYSKNPLDNNYYPIPNFQVNTNKIKYDAFDGKEIEFDCVVVLGDCIVLTELKSVMIPYTCCDLNNREEPISYAISQLIRRRDSIKTDWEKFKTQVSIALPDAPYDDEHIILVACTDTFDFTPTKRGDVYLTDDITFFQYFTSPNAELFHLNNYMKISTRELSLWKEGKPTPNEFRNYLENPSTVQHFTDALSKKYKPLPILKNRKYAIAVADYVLEKDPTIEQTS